MEKSALQQARAAYQPKLPKALQGAVKVKEGQPTQSVGDQEEIKKLFPNTYGMPVVEFEPATEANTKKMNVGVILSGGQAPGGHNVITGLFDQVKKLNPENRLFGFILGPGGLVDHDYMELTADIIDEYRNTGGFDMIGSGRTKLEKVDQFEKGLEIIRKLDIKAIVIIGGDDSNTNACVLAEYYAAKNYGVQVIGCPKTIDGDLKNEQIETSFGFDTACKTYSELIGNIERDCNSARKYWHFIKVMGRSASHIALECALQTQPNICLISEEVEAKKQSLDDIVTYIADVVCKRAEDGNNFGTVIIPEGLIEFIPAIKKLIAQLNTRCLPTWPVSWLSTATPTETCRYRSSRPRSCSLRWLPKSWNVARRSASTPASLLPSTTSSATRAAALLRLTTTPTTAMPWVPALPSSLPTARLATWLS